MTPMNAVLRSFCSPRILRRVVACLLLAFPVASADAQQRPFVTEDPESIGSGLVLIEGGFDYLREQPYPVSGLRGHLFRIPTLGVSIGVSSIAEVQVDGLSYQRLSVIERQDAPLSSLVNFRGDTTSDMDDLVIGAKVRVLAETDHRPAFALRFATKLPNAGNESGFGLDTMDFFNTLLVGKTMRSVRLVGNFGLGILSDPTHIGRQNDVIVYGLSVALAMTTATELVADINGIANTRHRDPPPGTDTSGDFRVGARYTRGSVRFDGAVVKGLTPRDAEIGVTAGFTWVFKGMEVP